MRWSFLLAALFLLVGAGGGACWCFGGGSIVEESPRLSPDEPAPGGKWTRAHIERVTHESAYGGRNFGTRTSTSIVLVLNDGTQDTTFDLEGADDTTYTLRFAPDGHALALFPAGGTGFRYVGLDVDAPGTASLHCPHWSFGGASVDGDPWAQAPTTHDLLVDILAGGDPPLSPTSHHGSELSVTNNELSAALDYACAHRTDRALVLAMARLARSGAPWPIVPDVACLQEEVKSDPAVQQALIDAALANGSGRDRVSQLKWAAKVLGAQRDLNSHEALAEILANEMALVNKPDHGNLNVLSEVSDELLAVTTARHNASAKTQTMLTAILTADACTGEGRDCRMVWEDAANALAELGPGPLASAEDAVAAALLKRLGDPTCGAGDDGRGDLAWALMRLVQQGGVASPAAENALVRAATDPTPCAGACESACIHMHTHALLGLSRVHGAKARAALTKIAAGACTEDLPEIVDETWARPLYVEASQHPLSCWARAAARVAK